MTSRYFEALKSFVEYDPEVTWAQVEEEFDRSRRQVRAVLVKHERHDLITRLDKNSGLDHNERYLSRLVLTASTDEDVTWWALSHLFGGRSKETLANTLYRNGFGDLVRRINNSSKGGRK